MQGKWGTIIAAVALSCPAGAQAAAWAPTGPTEPQNQLQLSAFPDGTAWAVMQTGDTLRTTDGGTTWQPLLTSPPGGQSVSLRMASPTAGWAARNGVVSRTVDAGATWTAVPTPLETANGFDATAGIGTTDGGRTVALQVDGTDFTDGCPVPTARSLLNTSHDGGATWTSYTLPYDSSGWTVRWHGTRQAAAVVTGLRFSRPVRDGDSCSSAGTSLGTDVLVTGDGGATWRKVHHDPLAWVATAWTATGRLVVGDATGEVHVSDDLGATWRKTADLVPDDDTLPIRLMSLDAVGRRVYALVNGGGVWRSDDGGVTWSRETSLFDAIGPTIGEVAAFDGERAVAGGPQPLSIRSATPLAVVPPLPGTLRPVVLRQGRRTLRIGLDGRARARLSR